MPSWISLITSLPTENATARMRTWRALKASGAAVLRDGVYLMPDQSACRATLEAIAADVSGSGGSAMVIGVLPPPDATFEALFDRSADYAALISEAANARSGLSLEIAPEALKQARKLRKAFTALSEIDFFPGEPRRQAEAALQDIEASANRLLSPDEPHFADADIPRLDKSKYLGKTWATRKRPWVDRLASAWLIRRFIDPKAKFKWLDTPTDCPKKALGFDFDGAAFTHVGAKVTFEVLVASFGIEDSRLSRIGALVHFLDVGGVQSPEAAGIESVLAGFRATMPDDDQLLASACAVFDGLLIYFQQETPATVKEAEP
jgi:hypothetical protein